MLSSIGKFFFVFILLACSNGASAANIIEISDRLSDSGPGEMSNHTFSFVPTVALNPGTEFIVTVPSDFVVTTASTTFSERNVELYIDGMARTSGTSTSPGVDAVSITRGANGSVRYELGPDVTIPSGSEVNLLIGNHTQTALGQRLAYSSSTGTTTVAADSEPIQNSGDLGMHRIGFQIIDGATTIPREFIVFINRKVSVGLDNTETIPPVRFNGAPTTTIAGTTQSVEISLETDERATCRFSRSAGVEYADMLFTFANTSLIFHSTVVSVTPDSFQEFFIRCADDEGNQNIDDYLIAFAVNAQPTGTANTDGDTSGDGTGTGNDGTGSGQGAGGTTGGSDGDTNETGNQTGGGGSGGGGGGGRGRDFDDRGSGGFEDSDGPFESGEGRIIISGYASPDADVTILADGQRVETVQAADSGYYDISIEGIARGAYTFGIYAVDQDGVETDTFSTSFTVSGARTSRLSNVTLAPSIAVVPDPVEPGELLTVSGYGLPDADVTVEIRRDGAPDSELFSAESNNRGFYEVQVDTSSYARDTYQVRVSAEQELVRTNFSEYAFFGVGQAAEVPLGADLNRDGFVNLTDFSILLFWWQSDGGDSNPPADINQDGDVSLTDFSILLFNWTG